MEGIAVTGRGFVSVAPDRATLSIGVTVLHMKASQAREIAAQAMQAVIAAVVAGGVSDDDRQTGILHLSPEYDYNDGTQKLRGYRVTNTVTVVARKLDDMPALIDDALAAGGDHVILHGIAFDIEDRRGVELQALAAAVADARTRAEALAAAAGVRLGPVVSVDGRERDPARPSPRMALMAESSRAATPVAAGSIEVEALADVVFGIAN